MAITPFHTPLVANQGVTAIDRYVPLPLDALYKGLKNKELIVDKAEANKDLLTGYLKSDADVADEARKNEIIARHQDDINSIMEEARTTGDFASAQHKLNKKGIDIKTDLDRGELAKIKQSYDAIQATNTNAKISYDKGAMKQYELYQRDLAAWRNQNKETKLYEGGTKLGEGDQYSTYGGYNFFEQKSEADFLEKSLTNWKTELKKNYSIEDLKNPEKFYYNINSHEYIPLMGEAIPLLTRMFSQDKDMQNVMDLEERYAKANGQPFDREKYVNEKILPYAHKIAFDHESNTPGMKPANTYGFGENNVLKPQMAIQTNSLLYNPGTVNTPKTLGEHETVKKSNEETLRNTFVSFGNYNNADGTTVKDEFNTGSKLIAAANKHKGGSLGLAEDIFNNWDNTKSHEDNAKTLIQKGIVDILPQNISGDQLGAEYKRLFDKIQPIVVAEQFRRQGKNEVIQLVNNPNNGKLSDYDATNIELLPERIKEKQEVLDDFKKEIQYYKKLAEESGDYKTMNEKLSELSPRIQKANEELKNVKKAYEQSSKNQREAIDAEMTKRALAKTTEGESVAMSTLIPDRAEAINIFNHIKKESEKESFWGQINAKDLSAKNIGNPLETYAGTPTNPIVAQGINKQRKQYVPGIGNGYEGFVQYKDGKQKTFIVPQDQVDVVIDKGGEKVMLSTLENNPYAHVVRTMGIARASNLQYIPLTKSDDKDQLFLEVVPNSSDVNGFADMTITKKTPAGMVSYDTKTTEAIIMSLAKNKKLNNSFNINFE